VARFSHVIAFAAAVLGLAACGGASAPSPLAAAASPLPAAPEELSVIVDRYWDESARGESRLGGGISPQFLADSLALERRSLAEILMLPRARLDADAALTFDIFKRERELAIEGAVYPAELLPVNGFSDLPQQFAAMGAGSGSQAFSSARDYENWLARIDDYAAWTDQALFNMREGLRRGYTMPRVIVKRALPVLAKLAEDNSANPFYRPLAMPETLHDPERSSLNSRLNAAIKGKVLPSYRALHDFLQAEYLPRARDSVGLSALPLGQSWYAYLVRSQTDAAATPADIHRQGLAEVERIRGRIQALSPEAPNGAAMQHSAGPDELLAALNDLKSKVTAAAPALFDPIPPADLEIRSAGFGPPRPLLSYLAASDAPRAAILYVNTSAYAEYSTGAVQSLFLQEGIPGRHYQIGLQRALTGIPKFRRFGTDPAFVEGWCLYAASLGEELGVYRDAEAKLEALLHQLRAAVGVVIDTGLHSQGWSRQQALEYLHAQLPMDDAVAAAAVDRTIALPGQALAAEAGALKIQALRARSQQELGARFDIRAFHAEVLKDGSMPLDLLEAKIQRWLAAAH
jgi:uncharacterized protein (DUF885 family)